ncbi:E3 ubiquitin-protein ligase Trim36-like [Saccostrea cucullata]|uniref:E3 ubiquitin-protein ligase Trim36-like n=1 Tax=Saccostrea cuccullata TaxID=36930 RepID=UPI002ED623A1
MSEVGVGAQAPLITCSDCCEPFVCTCSLCDTKLCRKHMNTHMDTVHMLSDGATDNTKCPIHSQNSLKCFCRTCSLPLCYECVTDGGHVSHEKSDLEAILEFFKEVIANENQELMNHIKPFYQKVLDNTEENLKKMAMSCKDVKKAIRQMGEFLNKEIEKAVENLCQTIDKKEKEETEQLLSQKETYSKRIHQIDDTVANNEQLMTSKNPVDIASFTSSTAYFHVNPSLVKVQFPQFTPNENCKMIQETILVLLGNFTFHAPDCEVPDLVFDNAKCVEMQLLEKPKVLKSLKNEFPVDKNNHKLYNLSCITSDEALIGGNSKSLFLRKCSSEVSKQFQTVEITCEGLHFVVSSKGILFYSDKTDRSIKRIASKQISTFLKFEKLEPKGLSLTSSGHLLVCLYRRNGSKVARYNKTGQIVQEIQYNSNQTLLYEHPKFICCNRNGDICTVDYAKRTVIVVDQFGIMKFSYTGRSVLEKGQTFSPCGIATDHLCNILITDLENNKIHLLDKYGKFIRFLEPDTGIRSPRAITYSITCR